jgi:prepilin-type N-terminal cleavage/methylation domain-containing protein
MDMADRKRNAGVTLVEMLVVLAVLVILAGFVFMATRGLDTQRQRRDLDGVFLLLKSALMEYHEDTGGFPEQAEEDFDEVDEHAELLYEQLSSIPASNAILRRVDQRFIVGEVDANEPLHVCDPWGGTLDYQYDPNVGNFPELISAGPDQAFETDDDISSKVK